MEFTNVAESLPAMAEAQPETPAVIAVQGRTAANTLQFITWTYRQLATETTAIAQGLMHLGLRPGTRVALMVKPCPELFVLTFALFRIGAVPIFIDPGIGLKSLKKGLNDSEPEVFIGIPVAHTARILFGWGKGSIKKLITVGRRLFWGGTTYNQLRERGWMAKTMPWPQVQPDDVAAILFTSGSTGPPKGVIYQHQMFASQVMQLRSLYDIRPGERDLATFPLFGLFAPALGMTSILPRMDYTRPGLVDPKEIIDPIQQFQATTMFGSPALLERVGSYGVDHGIKLSSLQRVISAGAPVRTAILQTFTRLLEPDVPIHTPYGATEALPVANIDSRTLISETSQATSQGAGVCVGVQVPDMVLRVIRITDEPIREWHDALCVPNGEIGELVVRGSVVSPAYDRSHEANALMKIPTPSGLGFYHRMGDLGYIDEHGRIWFCGRKSQRVITNMGTLFTIPCEGIFNAHPEVRRTALVGCRVPDGIEPVLCVELKPNVAKKEHERIRRELQALAVQHTITRQIKRFLFHPAFPVDIRHNAKIFRERLAKWAERA